jgi:nitroreductase
METLETIHTRRSIRKYQAKPVPDELIQKILAAAMSAPSAVNTQPWEFIVITDKDLLEECTQIHPHAQMAREAPVAILVCGDLDRAHEGFWVQDCAAATQTMLLAIQDLGLGAVWTGIYPREKRVKGFQKLLNLPKNIIPFALVPIGYPAQESRKEDRFDPKKIHTNQW